MVCGIYHTMEASFRGSRRLPVPFDTLSVGKPSGTETSSLARQAEQEFNQRERERAREGEREGERMVHDLSKSSMDPCDKVAERRPCLSLHPKTRFDLWVLIR